MMKTIKPAPMLAKALKGEPRKGSVFEPKLDGHRVIVHKEGDEVSVYSRTFQDQSGKLPHLEEAFRSISFDFTLDGEVVAVDRFVKIEGQDVPIVSFSGAQSVMGSSKARRMRGRDLLTFVVFDCLGTQGKDLTDVPDALRRWFAELIVERLRVHTKNVLLVPRWTKVDYQPLMAQVVEHGGEGLMIKNPLATYHPGQRPSNVWSKLKAVDTADVVVTGYKPGQGKFQGLIGAILFGQYKDGVLVERSACSGMDDETRRYISEHKDEYLGSVIEVRYFGRVGNGSFRHPNFVQVRTDKLAEECVWE
jgi:ATP-dependent DNA ligase